MLPQPKVIVIKQVAKPQMDNPTYALPYYLRITATGHRPHAIKMELQLRLKQTLIIGGDHESLHVYGPQQPDETWEAFTQRIVQALRQGFPQHEVTIAVAVR